MKQGVVLALMLSTACGESPTPSVTSGYPFDLPPGFPKPYVPEENALSISKVELGRHLFYDKRLSIDGTMACSSCHRQELAFTDGLATPVGVTGQRVFRNSMTLTNVAYYYPYTWENPLIHTLEEQALVPLFADFPLELGFTSVEKEVLAGMKDDPAYSKLFFEAFPDDADPFRADRVVAAIASFERSLISGNSPYDRFVYGGDGSALSDEAQLGLELFNSERLECYHCHSGLNFTSAFRTESSLLGEDYQNNGLYNLDEQGSYPAESPGLVAITGEAGDNGKFRVPTLRNVTKTAPYMHDGSIATLEEVLDHYARGGRKVEGGPNAGDGRENPRKSPFVRGFTLSDEERRAVLAFLESLTDETFLQDPRFSDPWGSQ